MTEVLLLSRLPPSCPSSIHSSRSCLPGSKSHESELTEIYTYKYKHIHININIYVKLSFRIYLIEHICIPATISESKGVVKEMLSYYLTSVSPMQLASGREGKLVMKGSG